MTQAYADVIVPVESRTRDWYVRLVRVEADVRTSGTRRDRRTHVWYASRPPYASVCYFLIARPEQYAVDTDTERSRTPAQTLANPGTEPGIDETDTEIK